jgi:hypothetical protein
MRIVNYVLTATMFVIFFSCSDRKPETGSYMDNNKTMADTTNSNLSAEWDTYRSRMNQRMNEMETDITNAKERRRNEKDAARIKEYDSDIERREKRRAEFKEKMDNFEARTKDRWQEFKAELDDLFTRDKNETEADTKNK